VISYDLLIHKLSVTLNNYVTNICKDPNNCVKLNNPRKSNSNNIVTQTLLPQQVRLITLLPCRQPNDLSSEWRYTLSRSHYHSYSISISVPLSRSFPFCPTHTLTSFTFTFVKMTEFPLTFSNLFFLQFNPL
jgi:hypothetical protein